MKQLRSRRSGLPRSAWAVLVLTLAMVSFLIVRPAGGGTVRTIDDLSTLTAALTGGSVALWRSRRRQALRSCWIAIGIALLSWGAGQAVWSWYELVAEREVPFPSLADAGFLGFPVAAAVGLQLFPRLRTSREGRLRELLDGVLITCSMLVLSLTTVLHAVLAASAERPFALAISTAYPVGDLLVASMTLHALSHVQRPQRGRLLWLTLGFAALVVADSGFCYGAAAGTYATGAVSDAGWFAGFLLLGVVATEPDRGEDPDPLRSSAQLEPWETTGPSMVQVALPYAPVVVASAAVLWQVIHGGTLSHPLAILSALVLVIVYGRQLLTLLENRRLVTAVRHQAFHDSLTGLANRALFLDRLEAALRSGSDRAGAAAPTGPAVAFLDLDDFKEVNDGLGHAAGDALLIEVGRRLRRAVRAGDLVARLGGDEFAVLLHPGPAGAEPTSDDARLHPEDPTAVVERLVATVAEPFDLDGRRVTVTTSVGLTRVEPGDDDSAMHILRNADLAMYAAKQSGKGRYECFDDDMSSALLNDIRLRQELVEAVATEQFFLLYQPLYDLRTDRLCGAEALVRWAHPSGMTLGPGAFLRQAETSQLMPALGRQLLERACREVRAWLDRTSTDDFFVSVNLSALQLNDPSLPSFVERTLERSGLLPRHLLLEVTESALLVDTDAAASVLTTLSALGVRIALDDFGTGYSSLAHLHQLPVHVLKTDGSFVAAMGTEGPSSDLVLLLAEIGTSLGLVTVGEGVETTEQLASLRRLGYDIAQGYLLGRPGPLAVMLPALPDTLGFAASAAGYSP